MASRLLDYAVFSDPHFTMCSSLIKSSFKMKLLSTVFATLASLALAQDMLVNSTDSKIGVNAISINGDLEICRVGGGGLSSWYYVSWDRRQDECTTVDSGKLWGMLNAYRAGGKEGVHWKYTNDPNDGECMNNWKHYSDNGQNLIATVSGRTSFQGSSRRWCALPVYRQGGVEGKQWDYCTCRLYKPPKD